MFEEKKNVMKTIIITSLVCLGCAITSMAQGTLQIEITNVKAGTGSVKIGLFDNERTFLKEASFSKTVKADSEKVVVMFNDIPLGEYAISVIHDENENGELDANFFGMPKEGFGFGNDAMGTFGPPSYEKALIKIGGQPSKQMITMKYL